MKDFDDALDRLSEAIINFFPDLLKAIAILIIGLFAIKFFRWFMKRLMHRKKEMDPTLIKFSMDILTWALRVLLFVMVVGALGVETSAFVAILGAAGLAIGLTSTGVAVVAGAGAVWSLGCCAKNHKPPIKLMAITNVSSERPTEALDLVVFFGCLPRAKSRAILHTFRCGNA